MNTSTPKRSSDSLSPISQQTKKSNTSVTDQFDDSLNTTVLYSHQSEGMETAHLIEQSVSKSIVSFLSGTEAKSLFNGLITAAVSDALVSIQQEVDNLKKTNAALKQEFDEVKTEWIQSNLLYIRSLLNVSGMTKPGEM